jgi:hypothetical protein
MFHGYHMVYAWVETGLEHWVPTPNAEEVQKCVVLRRLLPESQRRDGCVVIPPFMSTGFKVEYLRAADKEEIQRRINKGWRFEGDHDEVAALLQS